MPTVELVYDPDCPNVTAARAHLLRAFAEAGLTPRWSEYLASEAPEHARGFGSPTVLVDGRDAAGASSGAEACCRLYPAGDAGFERAPAVSDIVAALARAVAAAPAPDASGGWRSSVALVPGLGMALLPKVACPACWPAYAGLLSSAGLSFLMDTAWLLPLTAVFLVLAVGALSFRARTRRGYGPFAVGLAASAMVLAGKFVFDSDLAMYGGIALLVGASLYNSWPRRRRETCPACATSTG